MHALQRDVGAGARRLVQLLGGEVDPDVGVAAGDRLGQEREAGDLDVRGARQLTAVGELLDFRYRVPALPFGLELTSVRPAAGGIDVRVQARDTVLSG